MHVAFHALPTDCQLCATNYNMILDKDLLMYRRIRHHLHQTFHNTVEPHKCHIATLSVADHLLSWSITHNLVEQLFPLLILLEGQAYDAMLDYYSFLFLVAAHHSRSVLDCRK